MHQGRTRRGHISTGPTRVVSLLALTVLGGVVLAGCSPSTEISSDGPTEQGVTVLEEFFDHLESGQPAEAAALTSIDFPAEFVDDDFYMASAARPTDARIIDATGDDSYAVKATVEYVLDDPDSPVTATFTVTTADGERTVSWSGAGRYGLIFLSSPGRITVNDTLEYSMSQEGYDLMLLPGLYDISYTDPTGVTWLEGDGTSDFTLAYPVEETPADSELPENVGVTTSYISVNAYPEASVTTAVEEEITRLTTACTEEELTGPSCPPALREYGGSLVEPSTAEWFQEPDPRGYTIAEGTVHYTQAFSVIVGEEVFSLPAVYEGAVTRAEDGTITYTQSS